MNFFPGIQMGVLLAIGGFVGWLPKKPKCVEKVHVLLLSCFGVQFGDQPFSDRGSSELSCTV